MASNSRKEINTSTKRDIAMKKFALAAIAAAATVSLAGVAEARRHHDEGGWDRPHRHVDVVVFRRPDCSTMKIVKETDWGTQVKIIKRCF
jgi:hypothetical protein